MSAFPMKSFYSLQAASFDPLNSCRSKSMHKLFLLVLTTLLLCMSCGRYPEKHSDRVLFVGNSLTYVGNLPAAFSALASANGHSVSSDMIVRGGATLSERVADGSVARALTARRYTAIVLQERGGDLMCSFGPDSCIQSRQAIKILANLARKKGLTVVLLGTYQSLPLPSRRLVQEESSAAADAGIPYIDVSERLQRLRSMAPELTWFYTDGMHPGKDLVLLDAILIYKQLLGSYPDAKSFTVNAPIYTSASGLTEVLRPSDSAPPKADTPHEVSYASATVEKILATISKDGSGYRILPTH
jgi:hypothetical protein